MWKVWVVSHHLSTKVYTRMALADLFGNKQIICSKPVVRMWAFVSAVRTLYHAAMQSVLPLPKNGDKAYKRMKKWC